MSTKVLVMPAETAMCIYWNNCLQEYGIFCVQIWKQHVRISSHSFLLCYHNIGDMYDHYCWSWGNYITL